MEQQIITFCKPFLYRFLNTYIVGYSNRKPVHIGYLLEGAGSLEFWISQPMVVQTLDADIHVYLPSTLRSLVTTKEQSLFLEKTFGPALENYFKTMVVPKNKGVFDLFRSAIGPSTPFLRYNVRPGGGYAVLLVKIFGYDLADIVYDHSYTGYTNYYPLNYMYSFQRGNDNLYVLQIHYYVYAQIRILYQQYHNRILRDSILRDLGIRRNMKTNETMPYAPRVETSETLSYYAPWFRSFMRFYQSNRPVNKKQKIHAESPEQRRQELKDMATLYLEKYLLDPQQRIIYKEKYPETRCHKVIFRLLIVMEYFHVSMENNTLQIGYKDGFTSCTVFNTKPFIESRRQSIQPCLSKSVFGNAPPSTQQVRQIQNLGVRINPRHLDLMKAEECKNVYRLLQRYKTTLTHDQAYNRTVGRLFHPRQSICRWTLRSSEISNEMSNFYFHSMLHLDYTWKDPNLKSAIENIQKTLWKNRMTVKNEMRVYKTGRCVIYSTDMSSLTLKVGDVIPQYSFNSTSINPLYKKFYIYSSYQVGGCAYIIRLPPNIPSLYIGSEYGGYGNEYELLLPIGVLFRVLHVNHDAYVLDEKRNFIRLTTYTVEAFMENSLRDAVLSDQKEGLIQWDAYREWIFQYHKKKIPTAENVGVEIISDRSPLSVVEWVVNAIEWVKESFSDLYKKSDPSKPFTYKKILQELLKRVTVILLYTFKFGFFIFGWIFVVVIPMLLRVIFVHVPKLVLILMVTLLKVLFEPFTEYMSKGFVSTGQWMKGLSTEINKLETKILNHPFFHS